MDRIRWKQSDQAAGEIELQETPNGLVVQFSHPYTVEIKTLRSGRIVLKIEEPETKSGG